MLAAFAESEPVMGTAHIAVAAIAVMIFLKLTFIIILLINKIIVIQMYGVYVHFFVQGVAQPYAFIILG
jgi:uncharacterized membrane protein